MHACPSHRLQNIEQTEQAKKAMMEAKRIAQEPTKQEQEENYATARCKQETRGLVLGRKLIRTLSQSTVRIISYSPMPMH